MGTAGHWEKGCWISKEEEKAKLMVNNPLGHNKHTPKSELVGRAEHKYKLMTKEEQYSELKRLYNEKRYYSSMVLRYAQRVSFLMECMGLEAKKSEAESRAEKDFKEKEGE